MGGSVVAEGKLDPDLVAFELRWQRWERIRHADASDGGAIKGFGAGRCGDYQFGNGAMAVNDELNQDLPPAAHLDALRNHRHPITPDRGKYLHQIGLEVKTVGVAE